METVARVKWRQNAKGGRDIGDLKAEGRDPAADMCLETPPKKGQPEYAGFLHRSFGVWKTYLGRRAELARAGRIWQTGWLWKGATPGAVCEGRGKIGAPTQEGASRFPCGGNHMCGSPRRTVGMQQPWFWGIWLPGTPSAWECWKSPYGRLSHE